MSSTIWLQNNKILRNSSSKILLCEVCPCPGVVGERVLLEFSCCEEGGLSYVPVRMYIHLSPAWCGITTVVMDYVGGGVSPNGPVQALWEGTANSNYGPVPAQLWTHNGSITNPEFCRWGFIIFTPPDFCPEFFHVPFMFPAGSSLGNEGWLCDSEGNVPLPIQPSINPVPVQECDPECDTPTFLDILVTVNTTP